MATNKTTNKTARQTTSQNRTARPFVEILLGGSVKDFLGWLLFAAVLTAAFAGIVVWSASDITRTKHPSVSLRVSHFQVSRGIHTFRLTRIRRALELFKRERGQYPDGLKQLAQSGWISKRELLKVPGCLPLYRQLNSSSYELLCSVP